MLQSIWTILIIRFCRAVLFSRTSGSLQLYKCPSLPQVKFLPLQSERMPAELHLLFKMLHKKLFWQIVILCRPDDPITRE